jgi:effector-binding domain-containing protein
MYKKIALFLKSKNLSPTGNPLAVFHNYYEGNFDIEAGVPVASILEVPSGLNCSERAARKAVMLKYFGPYTMISKAYNALHSYLNANDLQIHGAGWEEYITNPNTESDSNKRQTNIYFPLE